MSGDRAQAVAEITAEIERVERLLAEKQSAFDADQAKHREGWDERLQMRLNDEIRLVGKRLSDLQAKRLDLELNGPPPVKPAPQPARGALAFRKMMSTVHPDPEIVGNEQAAADYRKAVEDAHSTLDIFYEHGVTLEWTAHLLEVVLVEANLTAEIALRRIRALEARLAEVETRGVGYRGVYQRADTYRRGDAVTHKGNLFIAVTAAEAGHEPGSSDAWQLAVKAGRDGKDAR